mmetsp:Transcript_14442/g.36554  ORF Transcript_14442/g.36554 Transcript_14442/m.36554 type:complete len:301 (-) Transcript_14442:35-937(-)
MARKTVSEPATSLGSGTAAAHTGLPPTVTWLSALSRWAAAAARAAGLPGAAQVTGIAACSADGSKKLALTDDASGPPSSGTESPAARPLAGSSTRRDADPSSALVAPPPSGASRVASDVAAATEVMISPLRTPAACALSSPDAARRRHCERSSFSEAAAPWKQSSSARAHSRLAGKNCAPAEPGAQSRSQKDSSRSSTPPTAARCVAAAGGTGTRPAASGRSPSPSAAQARTAAHSGAAGSRSAVTSDDSTSAAAAHRAAAGPASASPSPPAPPSAFASSTARTAPLAKYSASSASYSCR